MIKYFTIALIFVTLVSCDSKPKLVTPEAVNQPGPQAQSQNEGMASPANDQEVHQVQANEVLHTDRYTYMNVSEGSRNFWIATAKMSAEKGKKYMYRGGLMKLNFESQDFNRTFDTIYLVPQVIDSQQHPSGNMPASPEATTQAKNNVPALKIEGAVKLAELFSKMSKYNGKTIKVTGEVVKVNNGIMGRNWVHIREKGNDQDLTITTNEVVMVGENVAFEGKIAHKKDFGSGYFYDLIMEEGKRLK